MPCGNGTVWCAAPNRFLCASDRLLIQSRRFHLVFSLAAIFVAQAAGIHLAFKDQLMILLTLMLTSKGVAAVPRASLVILSGTLATFHLPLEGVAVILGVDAFLDMARTSVNLVGNCLASAVMARCEGELRFLTRSTSKRARLDLPPTPPQGRDARFVEIATGRLLARRGCTWRSSTPSAASQTEIPLGMTSL